jgi:NADPH-dependent 2,4-dienoyl-CoA reductase/sulfur reductase-like enzyme
MATRVGAATGITANLDLVRKATHAWMPLGENIVIIGGELVGIELAEFLCERGRQVTVVDDTPRLGKGLTLVRRLRILAELREHGVALCRDAQEIQIGPREVLFKDETGEARAIPADQVIVAKGATGDSSQAQAFRSAGLRVHETGDGTGVGYIEGAMRDAMSAVDSINAM